MKKFVFKLGEGCPSCESVIGLDEVSMKQCMSCGFPEIEPDPFPEEENEEIDFCVLCGQEPCGCLYNPTEQCNKCGLSGDHSIECPKP